jgi:hypothetical protein
MAVAGKLGTGPRIYSISTVQSEFSNSASQGTPQPQYLHNDGSHTANQEPSAPANPIEEPEQEYPCFQEDFMLRGIKMEFLPLLSTEDVLKSNFFRASIDATAVQAIIFDIATKVKQDKDKTLASLLGTSQLPASPTTKTNGNIYSMLKRYGISLEDQRVHQKLLSELYHLNKKHHNTTTLQFDVGDGKLSSFVGIPKSKNSYRLKENAKNRIGSRMFFVRSGQKGTRRKPCWFPS